MLMCKRLILVAAFLLAAASSWAQQSYYTVRLVDPKAVNLEAFGAKGDGVADDTAAIQAAIDRAQETAGQGIVFVPEGRYRVTKTVDVWPSIRLIGYGAKRPVLVLAPNTPGYQDKGAETYIVFFAGSRPGAFGGRGGLPGGGRGAMPAAGAQGGRGGAQGGRGATPMAAAQGGRGATPGAGAQSGRGAAPAPAAVGQGFSPARRDAAAPADGTRAAAQAAGRGGRGGASGRPGDSGPGTFYSAMSNIDIEIGEGNPGAVAVRGTYAQHCYLAHMDFRVGSALAGVHDTGNVMEDVRFFGGQYGIWTRTPSPGWQFTAVDATFDGQREAAIRETAAGMTLVRPQFRNVPTAVSIDPNAHDELWIKDGRMEDVTGPAVIVSLEQNARTEINMENVVCRRVPTFAELRESGKRFAAPGEIYETKVFSHGWHYADLGVDPLVKDVFETAALKTMPDPVTSDLVPLPPANTWVNIRSLGAKGDGVTDDTAVFRKAIAEHRAIYLPSGYYVISDTLALKPDTVLIGLHPLATQIDLLDNTEAFQGVGAPKPMIEAPKGGTNVLIGVGVYSNGINPRAVAIKWMAGTNSMIDDLRLLGGHGTNNLDGTRVNPYNNDHTADPDLNRRWDGQYPSLWVTDGGGGTFFDIWTPSTFAMAGMLVSDTSTEGRVYQMSSEHHVRYEIQFKHAANWRVYALQTEEERGEGGFALPLEVDDSSNLTFANFHLYRVISSYQPFPWAVKVSNSKNIRFRNFHCYSNSKVAFDAAVYDQTHDAGIRQREFAWLTLSGAAPAAKAARASVVLEPGAKVQKLAGGFFNISGGAVDPAGDFYFVDAHWQRIYRWSAAARQLATVEDAPLDPINLAFDKAGNLMVVSYAGNGVVYSFKPGAPLGALEILKPVDAAPRPGLVAVRPVGDWRVARDPATGAPPARAFQYLSPDGTTFISAGRDFVTGASSWGVKSADLLRAFGLARATPGKPFYVTSEAELMTWRGVVGPDGNLTEFKPFVQQGGEGVAVDANGNVVLAAGELYVYDPAGKLIETIATPQRPIQVVFGGADGRTLFIASRDSLFSVRTRVPGLGTPSAATGARRSTD